MSKFPTKLRAEQPKTGGEPAADKRRRTNPPSKQSRIISMLQSPNGTTISAMIRATDWQQHSVRGFLAGVVRKRLKLKLDSKKLDGERIYHILPSTVGKSRQVRPKS
jgi:hypothetical protein